MAAGDVYEIGDRVRNDVTFATTAGTPTDPDTITFTLKAPDGTVTTPTVTNDDVGDYHAFMDLTAAGFWYWEWEGDGTLDATNQGYVMVKRSPVAS